MYWFRSRKPTYNILVRIHEDIEAKALRYAQNRYGVLYPLLVISPRPSMLNGLPGEDVSYRVVPPSPQPREVCGRIVDREGAVYKGDVVAVKEAVDDVRGLVRIRGKLGVGRAVDAVESDFPIVGVAERTTVYAQAEGRHVSLV